MKNHKGQEEIVGFVIIIIIVSVALLILLGFMLRSSDNESVENYEIENFIQSSLQYTTDCADYTEFLSLQELIIACENGEICLNKENSCDVLDETLKELIEKGWNINEQSAIRGYLFKIIVDEKEEQTLQKGNETKNYKGGFQTFSSRGRDYEVSLNIYYD